MSNDVKRSLTIAGHRTSVSLEPIFWDLLKEIAAGEHRSLASLVGEIDGARVPGEGSLSSAIRVYIVGRLRGQLRQG